MSCIIYIGRECFHVEGAKHFANILEEKLGPDAAEYFRESLMEAWDKGFIEGEQQGEPYELEPFDDDEEDDYF